MTVGEIRAQLADLDPALDAVVIMNGALAPIAEVLAVPGGDFIVVRGEAPAPPPRKFTVAEEGVIGHLVRLGLDNDRIGQVLGRPADSIAKKRKTLGF